MKIKMRGKPETGATQFKAPRALGLEVRFNTEILRSVRRKQGNKERSLVDTCRFSMQNWCPYMSIADRKMDSTWL